MLRSQNVYNLHLPKQEVAGARKIILSEEQLAALWAQDAGTTFKKKTEHPVTQSARGQDTKGKILTVLQVKSAWVSVGTLRKLIGMSDTTVRTISEKLICEGKVIRKRKGNRYFYRLAE